MRVSLRASWRLLRLFFFVWSGVWLTFLHGSGLGSSERLARVQRDWYRRAVKLLGVEVRCHGEQAGGPALVVANHVSWLDIPVLGSRLDVRFLSKSEIARWPVIGWLARGHGTLFIRRGAHEVEAIIRDIAEALDDGEKVAIFPEATTTRGEEVRQFHPRLFAAAIATATPIQPVAIDYGREPDGSAAQASYAGDDRLFPHLWRLLCRERTSVELHILPLIAVEPDARRRDLARSARRTIVAALSLP
ncbi:MAG: 1-acyl-sn-glycerol-3-phosphate acyltransferase [Thioalkalivibrio sp.]|nr:1-acyl-sn-glycerol-3-phosphate acyltransferase [Thioalkalivibrio sp.]